MEMTYRDVEKYVVFYSTRQSDLINEMFKRFCFYNAESSSVAAGSVLSKEGSRYFSKYLKSVMDRDQGKNESSIEDKFAGVNFGKQD